MPAQPAAWTRARSNLPTSTSHVRAASGSHPPLTRNTSRLSRRNSNSSRRRPPRAMRARRDLLRRAVAAPAALAVSTGMQYRRRRYTRGVQSPKLREGGLMVRAVARYWWVVALRGLAALAFGLLALFSPAMTLAVLVLFFGAYALADGVLAIWTALRGETEHRLPMAL